MGFRRGADCAQIGLGAILGVRASGNQGAAVAHLIGSVLDPKSTRRRSESWMCAGKERVREGCRWVQARAQVEQNWIKCKTKQIKS